MRNLTAGVLTFLVAACAAAPAAGPERPEVSVQQLSTIFFGSSTSAPVHLDVTIENAHHLPMTIRSVRIEAGAGMGLFSIHPVQRELNQQIAPGGVFNVSLVATAYTRLARHEPNEPFSVRAIVDVIVAGKRHRQMYMFRDISM